MPEQSSGASSRAPAVAGVIGVAALIASAVVSVEPQTATAEGERLVAYQDVGGIWTICRGHTGPEVHAGLVASHAQCRAWYRIDMTSHMKAVLADTPTLKDNFDALKASGDFHFNAPRWWPGSPMRAHFQKSEWAAGCNSFAGYITLYKAPKPVKGGSCRTNAKGVLYCEARGLVNRRKLEQAICLGGA